MQTLQPLRLSSQLAAGLVVLTVGASAAPTAPPDAARKDAVPTEQTTSTKVQPAAPVPLPTRLAQITGTPSTPRAPATPPSSVAQLIAALNNAEANMNGDALIYTYGQAVTNPLLARGALAQLMFDYYSLRTKATSAMQASQAVDEAILRFSVMHAAQNQVTVQQNQIIIDQNQRIISLLEEIAKK